MRILFYDGDGQWVGGSRALARAAHGLARREHQVAFVCPAESRLERHLNLGSFEVVPHPPMSRLAAAWRLRDALRERFVEVVFVRRTRDQVVAAGAARMAGRSSVVRRIGHGERMRSGGPLTIRLASTGFIFAAEDELRRARPPAGAGLPHALAPLGVDPAEYADVQVASPLVMGGPDAGARHLVVIYNPAGRPAGSNALRVMSHLATRHPDLRMTMVGAGSQIDELRLHAAALRIAQRVSFLGARDDELQILRAADVGWVVAEGDCGAWGMLDLAALGVPVLAERSALSKHYIADGITGIQLPPANPAEAAGILARLLAAPLERESMGVAARARVAREFAESEMITAFENAALAAGDRSRW